MHHAVLLLSAALVAAPAYADRDEAGTGQLVVESTRAGTADDKIICKGKREARTGSNMRPGRLCMRESEWKEREVFAKRELQRLQDKQQTPGNALGR